MGLIKDCKSNLFTANHLDIFPSSKFAFINNSFISLFKQNKLLPLANMTGFKNCGVASQVAEQLNIRIIKLIGETSLSLVSHPEIIFLE